MKLKIPFTRLWVHEPLGRKTAKEAIGRVFEAGRFILGAEVEAFEREFGTFLGVEAGVGVGSGTDAITLGLMAGGVQAGDEVLVPAFAPSATASAILAAGATPVLVDVKPDFGLDVELARACLSPRTRAIVVVHLFGGMDDMTPILALAKEYNLWVVEDCAHAHGALYLDKETKKSHMAGTLGNVGAFSFYPTKNLGGIGDGGFCCSGSPNVVEKLRRLRQYGWLGRDDSSCVGRNSRLDEIQAAFLRDALPHLDCWNRRRRDLASAYLEAITTARTESIIVHPSRKHQLHHVFHQFVVRSVNRDQLRRALTAHGIECGIHYPRALSQQSAYKTFTGGRLFPVAERAAAEVLSLPIDPHLSNEDAHGISLALNAFQT